MPRSATVYFTAPVARILLTVTCSVFMAAVAISIVVVGGSWSNAEASEINWTVFLAQAAGIEAAMLICSAVAYASVSCCVAARNRLPTLARRYLDEHRPSLRSYFGFATQSVRVSRCVCARARPPARPPACLTD